MSAALVAADVLEEQGHWPLGAACAGYVPADHDVPLLVAGAYAAGNGIGYAADYGQTFWGDGSGRPVANGLASGDGTSGYNFNHQLGEDQLGEDDNGQEDGDGSSLAPWPP